MATSPTTLRIFVYFLSGLLLFPLLLVIAVSLTQTSYITFPPKGITLAWYGMALQNPRLMQALGISVKVGILSAALATALGIVGALFLRQVRGWLAHATTALFLAPVTVPVIVLAIGLLFYLTSLGLVRTISGLVLGHVLITFPYCVRLIRASIDPNLDRLEGIAAVLGASPTQVFLRVTLPSLRAGLTGALLFAFVISLNNVTIALFVSGARTQTLPLVMLQYTKEQVTPDIAALASFLVIVTFVVMVLLERTFGLYRLLEHRVSR